MGDITQCKSTVIRNVHDVVELLFVAAGIVFIALSCFFIVVGGKV